jgi:hypothetical protein
MDADFHRTPIDGVALDLADVMGDIVHLAHVERKPGSGKNLLKAFTH